MLSLSLSILCAPSGVPSAGVARTAPCSSTKASVCGASCDLRLGLNLNVDTQREQLRKRIGRAVGKGGRINTEVEQTCRVRVRCFDLREGKRAGVVRAISDARDKDVCKVSDKAAIQHIQGCRCARQSVEGYLGGSLALTCLTLSWG